MILEVVLLSICSAVFGSPLRGLLLDLSPPLPEAKSFFQDPLVGRIVEFTRHLPHFKSPKFHNNALEDQEHTMRRHKPHEIPYFEMKQEPREEYISSKPVVINEVHKDEKVNVIPEYSYSDANDETTETYSTTTEDIETTTFDEDEDLLNRMGVPPAVAATLLG